MSVHVHKSPCKRTQMGDTARSVLAEDLSPQEHLNTVLGEGVKIYLRYSHSRRGGEMNTALTTTSRSSRCLSPVRTEDKWFRGKVGRICVAQSELLNRGAPFYPRHELCLSVYLCLPLSSYSCYCVTQLRHATGYVRSTTTRDACQRTPSPDQLSHPCRIQSMAPAAKRKKASTKGTPPKEMHQHSKHDTCICRCLPAFLVKDESPWPT